MNFLRTIAIVLSLIYVQFEVRADTIECICADINNQSPTEQQLTEKFGDCVPGIKKGRAGIRVRAEFIKPFNLTNSNYLCGGQCIVERFVPDPKNNKRCKLDKTSPASRKQFQVRQKIQ